MGKSNLEKIYANIDQNLNKNLNGENPFSLAFLNALESGKKEISQKEIGETKVFDTSWLDAIDEALPHIEKIILNPRKFIKEFEEIVPVELAKKTTKDSVRHLAQHTQYIRSVDDNNVTPNKVLTSFKDEDLAIYENRFIKTLLEKLFLFVERRYNALLKNQESFIKNDLRLKSDFNYATSLINVEVNVNIKEDLKNTEIGRKNQLILERVLKTKDYIKKLLSSRFMQQLEGARKVTPPIMKTNIIMKQPDYRAAYKLWIKIESYPILGYDVDVQEKDLPIDDDYLEDIYHLIELSALTLIYNQKQRTTDYEQIPTLNRRVKQPKIGKWYNDQIEFINGEIKLEDNEINEFYYQKSKKNVRNKLTSLVRSGYSYEEAYRSVIEQMTNINNAIITKGLLNADYEHILQDDLDEDDNNNFKKFLDNDLDIDKEILEKKLVILERQANLLRIADEIKRNDLEVLNKELEALNKEILLINYELTNLEINEKANTTSILEEMYPSVGVRKIKARERDLTKHLELLNKVKEAGLERKNKQALKKLHEKERFERLKKANQKKKNKKKNKEEEKNN